jgi:hypothetical protein
MSPHGCFPSYHAPVQAGPFVFGHGFGGGCPLAGPNPAAYPQVGVTPDGIPVHQDGIDYRTADRRVVVNIGGQLLYYDHGRIHDGQGGVYDAHGTPLQPVGQLADSRPVYPQMLDIRYTDPNRRFFTLRGNQIETVIQLNNGHFAYANFNYREAWINSSHTTYREFFFDGQNWFDLNGNTKLHSMEWKI